MNESAAFVRLLLGQIAPEDLADPMISEELAACFTALCQPCEDEEIDCEVTE